MAAAKSATGKKIYQLKISLRGITPPIWRRIHVPSDVRLSMLHPILQVVMGWTNSHMHQFKMGKTYYGETYPDDMDGMPETRDERKTKLAEVVSRPRAKFVYEYDFGDSWEHEIALEKILPAEAGVRYPLCLAGQRACPPEDCGGVWGYGDLLDALQDEEHPDREELLEWLGEGFDPEAFHLAQVNAMLKQIR